MFTPVDMEHFRRHNPPVPGATEPSWHVASRAIAAAWAKREPVDLGFSVDQVFAVPDPGWAEPSFWPDEREDADRYAAVRAYLDRHLEVDGGVEVKQGDAPRTIVAGIVGDAQSHEAALTRIAGPPVAVEPRSRTMTELQAIADRLRAGERELAAADVFIVETEPDPRRGVVTAHLAGGPTGGLAGRAAAESFADTRRGDVITLWSGVRRYRKRPVPFGSWTPEGRTIRVFFGLGVNGQHCGKARVVEETDGWIAVAASQLDPIGPQTLRWGYRAVHADLALREPVGDRAVVDATDGAIRPSLAQLRGT